MSFLAEFKTIVTDLQAEGHVLAAKASGLFGTAEKVITGIVSELEPKLAQLRTEVTSQFEALLAQAVADIKADIAEAKSDASAAVSDVTASATSPDISPAGPAAPAV